MELEGPCNIKAWLKMTGVMIKEQLSAQFPTPDRIQMKCFPLELWIILDYYDLNG